MAFILLEQDMPHGLRHILTRYDVRTAYNMGWSDLGNSDLMAAAEAAGFDVTITADRNLRYQHHLAGRHLALIVGASSAWPLVRRNFDAIARAVSPPRPGVGREVIFGAL